VQDPRERVCSTKFLRRLRDVKTLNTLAQKIYGLYVCRRYNNYTMEFEFDPIKSNSNKEKQGIDFYEAQTLWSDPDLIEIPVKTSDEPRFLVIGNISGKYWSGVITYRSEKIRIISVRRSRKEAVDIYESS
jgi:uncharacterized DUF497 family protein